ncbi:MAG: diguanylate cyclase [Oscillospiraceae bacterium]|nr:diguanylate cyclase [Oscillospiraceae bacterium]
MKHILIVDDNKANLTAAKAALADLYKTTAVISGAQTFKFLEKNIPDLILLDINMPEMDGFEVLEKIKADSNCCNIPVIFLTADSDAETESKCLEAGALDFIAKPFVPAVMRSRIGRILEVEELRKSLADRLEQKIQEVSDIKSKSFQDALTGLWNRAYTEEKVGEMLKNGTKGALFMMDMDNFKAINDNYGHIAGDNTLKKFGETLCKFAGENDVVCRIGGDEFMTFVAGSNSKGALGNHANDIISEMCCYLEECKFETNSSVSVGIAQFPEDGTDFKSLYNAADKALYYVKQNGKNSYHFFSDQNEVEKSRASQLVDINYLREIMKRNDPGKGSYVVDYDNFHHVFNFVRRLVERSNRDVHTVLFTLNSDEAPNAELSEIEMAVELLEKAIFTSLRRVDVSTRYSSRQVIVILLDANVEGGSIVANRILSCFGKLYTGKLKFDYDIVKMEGAELPKNLVPQQT